MFGRLGVRFRPPRRAQDGPKRPPRPPRRPQDAAKTAQVTVKMAPRGSQKTDSPRCGRSWPPRRPKTTPSLIFDKFFIDFLVDVGFLLDRFLVDFCLIFDSLFDRFLERILLLFSVFFSLSLSLYINLHLHSGEFNSCNCLFGLCNPALAYVGSVGWTWHLRYSCCVQLRVFP